MNHFTEETKEVFFPPCVQVRISGRTKQPPPRELPIELADQIEKLWSFRNQAPEDVLVDIDSVMVSIVAPRRAAYFRDYDMDGQGTRTHQVFRLEKRYHFQDRPPRVSPDYWSAVTDVQCPCCETGMIRWHEAGYVPGYRRCDGCLRHFQAAGDAEGPELVDLERRD